MQGLVVAQPAAAGGKTREANEKQLVFGDCLKRSLLAGDKHHDPRHKKHHTGADSRPQIGLHAGDADFAQNSRQAGKHRRAQRIPQPRSALGLAAALLFLNHQKCADGDEHHTDALGQTDPLLQKNGRQQDGQHRAGLINGHHLVHVTQLQRLEVAQPACAGGKAGQHQKQERPSADGRDRLLRADDKHHQPGENQHHNGADGGSHSRVRFLDAALGQNGGQPR